MDNNRGHTRSFSSEKIFQDYRAQQVRSTPAAAPAQAAPAVPAAALGSVGGSPGKHAAVAAGLVGSTAAVGGKSQMSSFDEEVQDDAPPLGGGVRLSDPLGVS